MEEQFPVTKATKDDELFERYLEQNRGFIMNCIFKTVKRYVTTGDDEWSIALVAFSDAVSTYEDEKGTFHNYAERVIRNRLMDYYRTQRKYRNEFPVSPEVLESGGNSTDGETVKIPMDKSFDRNGKSDIAIEIEAVSEELKTYGFSFFDLTKGSPKASKTKGACKKAIQFVINTPEVIEEIRRTKQLPIKKIQRATDLPRKLLEHHRKYIIAVMEILLGDYPCLAEYVSYLREVGD